MRNLIKYIMCIIFGMSLYSTNLYSKDDPAFDYKKTQKIERFNVKLNKVDKVITDKESLKEISIKIGKIEDKNEDPNDFSSIFSDKRTKSLSPKYIYKFYQHATETLLGNNNGKLYNVLNVTVYDTGNLITMSPLGLINMSLEAPDELIDYLTKN